MRVCSTKQRLMKRRCQRRGLAACGQIAAAKISHDCAVGELCQKTRIIQL
ncbi:hypothetical protein HSBAA_05880 [Vreelandella sulfidaeris]|uniref:Uncharacterized protein n=1 Tax=Vreelandella sulfidaeris TaxID=115553 RepID=A0A455U093_9GAMM|nr:hypothetical protein HSBAA_05880 [Halomonas sulfidaeris]